MLHDDAQAKTVLVGYFRYKRHPSAKQDGRGPEHLQAPPSEKAALHGHEGLEIDESSARVY